MYNQDEYDALKAYVVRDDIDEFTQIRASAMLQLMDLLDGIHFIDAGSLILAAIDTVYAPGECDFIAEMFEHYKEWRPLLEQAHNARPLDNLFGDVGADLDELFGGDDDVE